MAEKIEAIIFNCAGMPAGFNRTLSPSSEKFLNLIYQRNYKLAIISGEDSRGELKILKTDGTRKYFKIFPVSINNLAGCYSRCLAELGASPDRILVLGRDFDDLKCGEIMRCPAAFIVENGKYKKNGESEINNRIINSVRELEGVLS